MDTATGRRPWGSTIKRRRLISGATDALFVAGSVAVVALVFFLLAHFTFARSKPHLEIGLKHISVAELRKQVTDNYQWKVFWVGPRDSKDFEFQALADGVVQITYLHPDGVDRPEGQSFNVFSARSEADRAKVYHRINSLAETTATTPKGLKIVFNETNMAGERVYLANGIAAIEFPAPQSLVELESAADSLLPIS